MRNLKEWLFGFFPKKHNRRYTDKYEPFKTAQIPHWDGNSYPGYVLPKANMLRKPAQQHGIHNQGSISNAPTKSTDLVYDNHILFTPLTDTCLSSLDSSSDQDFGGGDFGGGGSSGDW